MRLLALKEAKTVQPDKKNMWFVIDRADELFVIGPFNSPTEANKYIRHMEVTYGSSRPGKEVPVMLNMEVVSYSTPYEYEQSIAEHHEWANED